MDTDSEVPEWPEILPHLDPSTQLTVMRMLAWNEQVDRWISDAQLHALRTSRVQHEWVICRGCEVEIRPQWTACPDCGYETDR